MTEFQEIITTARELANKLAALVDAEEPYAEVSSLLEMYYWEAYKMSNDLKEFFYQEECYA